MMTSEPQPNSPLSAEQLAVAILKQVEFAERSDEEGARNALQEIAALCRQALEPTATPGAAPP
jgi:hypothetical protein